MVACFLKTRTEGDVTRDGGSLFPYCKTRRIFVEDGLSLAVFCRCPVWGERRKKLDGLGLIPLLKILTDSMTSVWRRLRFSETRLSWLSLSLSLGLSLAVLQGVGPSPDG